MKSQLMEKVNGYCIGCDTRRDFEKIFNSSIRRSSELYYCLECSSVYTLMELVMNNTQRNQNE